MKSGNAKRSPRRVPRQQRARLTVDAVLEATVRIVKREGLAHVTTNRIADVAGVSIGSLYQYFPDKQAIFAALHSRHVEQVDLLIERTFRAPTGSSLEELFRSLIGRMIDLHAADPALHEMLLGQIPHRDSLTVPFPTRVHGAFRSVISSNDANGLVDLDRTAFVAAHMVDALSHGAAFRRPPGVSLADAKAEAQEAVLAYLGHQYSARLPAALG